MTHSDQCRRINRSESRVVIHTVGNGVDLVACHIYIKYRGHAHIGSKEIQRLGVGVPGDRIGCEIPIGSKIGLLTGGAVHNEYAVLVTLISVMLHAEPCQIVSVGRECGRCIIAHHTLGDIFSLLGCHIIEIEIGVGGDGILHAGLLAAHIHKLLAVGRPGKRLNAAKRLHRRLVRLTLHDVNHVSHTVAVKVSKERMRHFSHPFIPVLIHEVVDDASRRLGKIRINILGGAGIFHIGYHQHLTLIGRELEAKHSALHAAHTLAVGAVGIHHPYLGLVAVGIKERDFLAAVDPHALFSDFGVRVMRVASDPSTFIT